MLTCYLRVWITSRVNTSAHVTDAGLGDQTWNQRSSNEILSVWKMMALVFQETHWETLNKWMRIKEMWCWEPMWPAAAALASDAWRHYSKSVCVCVCSHTFPHTHTEAVLRSGGASANRYNPSCLIKHGQWVVLLRCSSQSRAAPCRVIMLLTHSDWPRPRTSGAGNEGLLPRRQTP